MKISVIIPAFNEEGNIEKVYNEVSTIVNPLGDWEIIFVDDGSTDGSLQKMREIRAKDPRVFFFSFSRNFGHQNALKCGIDFATGDAVISIDADLQHPPSLIPQMIAKWQEGFDIVYTLRKDHAGLPARKKGGSRFFYMVMNWLSDVKLDEGMADFRLMDKKVAAQIRENREANLFLRGYISWLGFRQFGMEYTASERYSGETKYTLRKMISVALHGITSFSIKPLRFSILIGLLISAGGFGYALYAIIIALFTDLTVHGWASVVVSVLVIGGIQLIILGVMGEYIGKLFMQVKNRPGYVVREAEVPGK